jgi:WXG100 family type VII secretion target
MSRFEVDSGRVAQASSKVDGTVTAIRSEVATMLQHLQDLQSVWQGHAASSCAELVAEWQGVQVRVENALEDIVRSLGSAAQTYSDAEAQAAGLFVR